MRGNRIGIVLLYGLALNPLFTCTAVAYIESLQNICYPLFWLIVGVQILFLGQYFLLNKWLEYISWQCIYVFVFVCFSLFLELAFYDWRTANGETTLMTFAVSAVTLNIVMLFRFERELKKRDKNKLPVTDK